MPIHFTVAILYFQQSILQGILHFFILRYAEVKKYGGDPRDVCFVGESDKLKGFVPDENDDVPEDEDDDVAEERRKVDSWQPGSTAKVSE